MTNAIIKQAKRMAIVTRKNIENRDVSWNHYFESLCRVHSSRKESCPHVIRAV